MMPPMPDSETPVDPTPQPVPSAAELRPQPFTDDEMEIEPLERAPLGEADGEPPQVCDADGGEDEEPDEEDEPGVTLGELHEELIATTTETRRGNRRTLEVLKNFGAVLDALSATVNDTHKAVRALPTALRPTDGGELAREWALALVEMADRLGRVAEGFARPPEATASWWPGARKSAAAWRDAWAMQSAAVGILRSHLESLLQRAALVRMEVVGRPFDPATMTAVESVVDDVQPDHTVLAELLAGWRHATSGQLIRPAQVRVSRLTIH